MSLICPRPIRPSRRQLLAAALAVPLAPIASRAAAAELEPLNRFPRMVQEYFVDRVRAIGRANAQRRSRLRSRGDAEHYVEQVRRKIRTCFGPAPEPTPLNPRVTGVVERQGYRIEKVVFESRPDFPVTANLYLPEAVESPVPAVVGTCGHSSDGKTAEAYQAFAQGLARLGLACLIYDPIGQGERLQYVDDDLSPRFQPGVTEHLLAGNQQYLVGEFFGAWRAWDGIRALDYLLTREEVDPQRVGVTGYSGGGTMTPWLSGLDTRWAMAAPSCFVTTFLHNLENELPADTEQCPPRALALGLDHHDFLAAMAPKPVILLAQERDYFDVRGTEEALARLEHLYELMDAGDEVSLFVGPGYHGYSRENREAMYGWFRRAAGLQGDSREPDLVIEKPETLWCTPRGQVAGWGARTVFDFTRESARHLAASRKPLAGAELDDAIRRVLRLSETPPEPPAYRILRYLRGRGYPRPQALAYAVETEPGIQALVYQLSQQRWYSRPPRGNGPAALYLSHHSADAELRSQSWLRQLIDAEPDLPWFTCDVRGVGESRPDTCGVDSYRSAYGSDYFYAAHALMLDRPYPGQKTFDVLRVLEWLAAAGHDQVHLIANGWGAIPGTFAAVLSDRVVRVTLHHALTSFEDVATTADYAWPLSTLPPDVLRHFDLPDCYRRLQKKALQNLKPWDASQGRDPVG